jgi:hypothetical protein
MAKPPKEPRSLSPIGDYDVGYCKPPTETQFKAGQPSANRNGRPKGSRNGTKANPLPIVDIPIARMTLEEAARPVQVREGDKVIKIPAYQAGVRATIRNAGMGSNPAMRNAYLIISHAHDQARAELEERVKAAVDYKEAATARVNYCKRRGIRFDWDIHPNDVHLDLNTGEVFIAGPKTKEERETYQMLFDALDFASASLKKLAEQVRENPRLKKARERLGLCIVMIDSTNAWLPAHYHEAVDPEIRAMAIMPDENSDESANEVDLPAQISFRPRSPGSSEDK